MHQFGTRVLALFFSTAVAAINSGSGNLENRGLPIPTFTIDGMNIGPNGVSGAFTAGGEVYSGSLGPNGYTVAVTPTASTPGSVSHQATGNPSASATHTGGALQLTGQLGVVAGGIVAALALA